VLFSCFALSESFPLVPRASGLIFKFCVPELLSRGNEGVGSRFQVLRFRTHFQRYRGRRVLFLCFALPDSFSAVPPCPVPFSCFVLPDSFSTVPTASALFFLFSASGLIFDGTESVEFSFQVLSALTHFRRYRGRRVPFICFALPDTFSAVPRMSGPVFMFIAPGLIFSGNEGVGSRFQLLRFRSRFWQYRGHRVPFSCYVCLDSFSAEIRVSGAGFMFCTLGVVSLGTEGVGSHFHVLRSRTHFRRC
jgi:hypothetical protein